MPKKFLRRHLPDADKIRANPALKPVSFLLDRTEIWHLHRRAAAGATFIGLFCAFVPIPTQMLLAAVLAVIFRCNLPISVALVWITNPLTFPPMFYFAYRLGAWLLDMRLETDSVPMDFDWWVSNLDNIGIPMLFGALVCGWVAGVTGFVVVRVLWRFHVIRRWKERRARHRQSPPGQLRRAVPPPGSDATPGGPESRPPERRAARTGRR